MATSAPLPVNNMQGALWMVASSVCFAAVGVAVKSLEDALPSPLIAFFRGAFGLVFILPFIARQGFGIFHTRRPGLHLLRLVGATGSIVFGYYALTHLPLATATLLSFTRPLFMILLAVIFLREVVRWRRGLATVVGFCGVSLVLGPTGIGFSLPALAGLAAAVSISIALSVVRHQSGEDGPLTFMAWFATGSVVLTAPLAVIFWETPQGIQWYLLIFIGLASSVGQFFLIKALSIGEATVMNPIDYSQIVIAALFGYFLFSEMPTVWTVAGAVVIAVSTLYILFRDAEVKQIKMPPPTLSQ